MQPVSALLAVPRMRSMRRQFRILCKWRCNATVLEAKCCGPEGPGRPRSTRASNKDVPACDQHGFQELPVNKPPTIAVDDVKAMLRRFTAERQQWRPDAAALELGDLILWPDAAGRTVSASIW